MRDLRSLVLFAAIASPAAVVSQGVRVAPMPPRSTAPQSPPDELATFRLPAGFRAELVAAEPLVIEPAMGAWDAAGRMFVAELRTYMQDEDGTGTREPRSVVARLEDTDGDGIFDRRTEYATGLVLPRMVLPLDHGRVLIQETYDGIVWQYFDSDDDGIAERREELFRYGASGANLEHQDSSLIWGIDNWLYTAMGGKRLRLNPDGVVAEDIAQEFAQWGLATDDVGRQFFSSAGGEQPAYGFQQHPQYGKIGLLDGLAPGFEQVWPILALRDVQGGLARVRDDGSLNHFTGCCGQSIYRATALPGDCRGNYFLCEPVGRLIRRARIEVAADGRRVLHNVYDHAEFLASTDPNFRPVWSATGPDGGLYVIDMYRGIIQEGNWVGEGSYLRPVVLEHQLEKNIGRGRIWRIVHDDHPRQEFASLRDADVPQLVGSLRRDNGFWRETAQRLLVLRRANEALPALVAMVRDDDLPLARLHAIWTLSGLDALDAGLIEHVCEHDADPRVRAAAIRAAEPLLAAGDERTIARVLGCTTDVAIDVRVQAVQSLRYVENPSAHDAILEVMLADPDNEFLREVGAATLAHGQPDDAVRNLTRFDGDDLRRWQAGRTHYRTLCIACHGPDGNGVEAGGLALAPSLIGSRRLLDSDDATLRILLHGMVGAIDDKSYPGNLMAPMGSNEDEWLAAVLTYSRNAFGNSGAAIRPAQVARVRVETEARATPFTVGEIDGFLPVSLATMQTWTLAASHGADTCAAAIDGRTDSRFTTGTPMRPGMWFQIDFGTPLRLRKLRLDTSGSDGDYPRGWEVVTSMDAVRWSDPIAAGRGDSPLLEIPLPDAAPTRYVRVRQTGEHDGLWWSIHELRVFGGGARSERER